MRRNWSTLGLDVPPIARMNTRLLEFFVVFNKSKKNRNMTTYPCSGVFGEVAVALMAWYTWHEQMPLSGSRVLSGPLRA
jgi:hypothetical protein